MNLGKWTRSWSWNHLALLKSRKNKKVARMFNFTRSVKNLLLLYQFEIYLLYFLIFINPIGSPSREWYLGHTERKQSTRQQGKIEVGSSQVCIVLVKNRKKKIIALLFNQHSAKKQKNKIENKKKVEWRM